MSPSMIGIVTGLAVFLLSVSLFWARFAFWALVEGQSEVKDKLDAHLREAHGEIASSSDASLKRVGEREGGAFDVGGGTGSLADDLARLERDRFANRPEFGPTDAPHHIELCTVTARGAETTTTPVGTLLGRWAADGSFLPSRLEMRDTLSRGSLHDIASRLRIAGDVHTELDRCNRRDEALMVHVTCVFDEGSTEPLRPPVRNERQQFDLGLVPRPNREPDDKKVHLEVQPNDLHLLVRATWRTPGTQSSASVELPPC